MEQSNTISEKNKKKIVWISILQGFTMLLVVMGHSDLNEKETIPVIGLWYSFFQPFRMPLFILISGYLFWLTRIAKNKEYSFVVIDKLKRLGIPFVFFTIVGFLTKYFASQYVKHPIEETGIVYVVHIVLGLKDSPLGALWFVYVTFFMMLLYPLYKYILESKVLICITIIIGIVLNIFPIEIHLFMIDRISKLFVYFFVGLVIGKYKLDEYVRANIGSLIMCITLYIVCFVVSNKDWLPISSQMLTFLGIIMAFHFVKYAEKYFPNLFLSFRFNTYQIYLISVFPQMAIEMIYRQIGSQYFVLFYIVNIFVGLYFPVLVVKFVTKYNIKLLKPCIGL